MTERMSEHSQRTVPATSAVARAALAETLEDGGTNTIHPFHVNFLESALEDLRRRLAQSRLPERETVSDFSQGVPLKTIQQLLRYWQTDYDWRKAEGAARTARHSHKHARRGSSGSRPGRASR